MPVSDLARNEPVTAAPDEPLQQLASTMRDERIGSVIVEQDGEPVGIVTDRDIAVRAVADGGADGRTASDVMTEEPCCVDGDTGLLELTQEMCDNAVRRIPVMEDGELSGIITFDDVERLLTDEHQNLSEVIAANSPAY